MHTKNLSFHKARWAEEISKYYFQIDYYQGKANRITNTLSRFLQTSQAKKKNL